jgi:hypothetical protein
MKFIRSWRDPTTRREVWQLTNCAGGAMLDYFRLHKQLADGRLLALAKDNPGGELLAINAEGGDVETLPISIDGGFVRLQIGGQRLWNFRSNREVWCADLPHGRLELVARLPEDLEAHVETISCDGRLIWLREQRQDLRATPPPTSGDPVYYWKFINRPRNSALWAYDVQSKTATCAMKTDGVCANHFDASPIDPTLVRYCLDVFEPYGQRVWSVRADGTGHRKVREQARGEMITHEFWWPDGKSVGYTYQDRRAETNPENIPLAEYAPSPTRLGIADADGREIYLSDPLNCYHSHIYVSPDAKFVSGEGTHDHQFVYAAPFSCSDPRIDLQPLAALHTPYVAFRGQNVEVNFSANAKWLLFNDTIDGKYQVCGAKL